MKILVTGANGFIGKNLVVKLKSKGYGEIYQYDINNTPEQLESYLKDCDFIFHLAGINRPQNELEFKTGNTDFTQNLLNKLENRKVRILMSSSTQAVLNNPYGISKLNAENAILDWSKNTGNKALIYRLTNVFGKWCNPNYNSVVATFCYNIANGLPIKINDETAGLKLVYIDDVTDEFINALNTIEDKKTDIYDIEKTYNVTLGKLSKLIYLFKDSRESKAIADMSDEFTKKLYSTYLSYLPENNFSYPLKMNIDNRGSFTEFIKTPDRGQVSINISKPGITKGNHWHNSKNEKFLVVSGNGVIRFRKINSKEVLEYFVSGDKLEVVDIPTGYTHNIENLGNADMVTVMWANEEFDPDNPDTIFEKV